MFKLCIILNRYDSMMLLIITNLLCVACTMIDDYISKRFIGPSPNKARYDITKYWTHKWHITYNFNQRALFCSVFSKYLGKHRYYHSVNRLHTITPMSLNTMTQSDICVTIYIPVVQRRQTWFCPCIINFNLNLSQNGRRLLIDGHVNVLAHGLFEMAK